ncbi:LysM peptidoglycan-binding domain-containing protein [Pedosphaera parvula]|uniref:Peptidoglycan-binding LysM n=1 Tax=Pedosphaera parvula (strain Ellin514) TaxID=320771 RepID=B9XIG8_PEDPL|nr:LysM peptidoglycan-binding domain-containing protein [Pedosphaera parvula]EEF60429.1 Peptidoglycan-binding LysM [Pedosphaera parvula Ellin514]
MNNSNPLVPQGSLMEQQNKGRNRFKVAVFCVIALHIVFFGGLLMVGCKKDKGDTTENTGPQTTSNLDNTNNTPPPLDTNTNGTPPAVVNNNTPAPVLPAPPTNDVVAPTVPPVSTPGATSEYVVTKGDSYYTIGKKFGVSSKAMQNANPTIPATKLKVGQKIQIPAASAAPATTGSTASGSASVSADATSGGASYTVKSGDTLAKIAKKSGVSVKALQSANNLKTARIKVGDKLKIPAKSSAPATTTPEPAPAASGTGTVPSLTAPAPAPAH